MLKKLFHIYNFLLLILYLYPGSIMGYVFFRNFYKQPQLTNDFFSLSSNHFFTFFGISLLGLLTFKDLKKLINYLIFMSIFLELSHLLIPNRLFEFTDLFGNLFGVIAALTLLKIYNYWKKL